MSPARPEPSLHPRLRPSLRPAVFLDRDGTLIEYVPRLVDAGRVRLLPGAGEAVAALRASGRLCVVVTNQPVLGLGLLDEAGLVAIHAELDRQLAATGARIDAYGVCPVVGESADRTVVEHPDRKPGPGLLLRAARDYALDLGASFMIGDSLRDLLAGRNAGCRGTILVRTGLGERELAHTSAYDHVCPDLRSAAETILADDRARERD